MSRITEVNGFWFDIEILDNKRCKYSITVATGEGNCNIWTNDADEGNDFIKYYRDSYEWNIEMAKLKGKALERNYNEKGWSRE